MKISEWDLRYRTKERPDADLHAPPTPLVVGTVADMAPGRALDIACGTGRNALWMAERGWNVTAVDGAPTAIQILNDRIRDRGLKMTTRVVDLEKPEFAIEPESFDLICCCYYLQRDLIPKIRAGLRPGGVAIVIVHVVGPGEAPNYKHTAPGELRGFFEDWEILHEFHGLPDDSAHKRAVDEVVARKRL
ncbi:MAG TPA: methyltransferase domain-containing protein [Bryobacteraceae bacterium]|nr:methyltransferase domain-containing protein [Bryobacteraceae bacterium]